MSPTETLWENNRAEQERSSSVPRPQAHGPLSCVPTEGEGHAYSRRFPLFAGASSDLEVVRPDVDAIAIQPDDVPGNVRDRKRRCCLGRNDRREHGLQAHGDRRRHTHNEPRADMQGHLTAKPAQMPRSDAGAPGRAG
jgi:hypothetical protein